MNKTNLENLNKYIEDIISSLLQSDKIVNLVGDIDPNMYLPNRPKIDAQELLDKNVFARPYIEDMQKESMSYINISFDKFRLNKNVFRDGFIVVEVNVHPELDSTNFGYRHLLLMSEIDNVLSNLDIGVCDLENVMSERIQSKNGFIGYRLIYKMLDFK